MVSRYKLLTYMCCPNETYSLKMKHLNKGMSKYPLFAIHLDKYPAMFRVISLARADAASSP